MKMELSVIAGLLLTCTVHGQLQYTRSSFTSVYVPLTNTAIKLNPGYNPGQFCNSSGTLDEDDGTAYIGLPFNFSYAGTNYTTSHFLGICTNGFVYPSVVNTNSSKFVTPVGNLNSPTSSIKNVPVIAPYWNDMVVNRSISGFTGAVSYEVSGLTGSRVLTVEWANMPSARGFTQRALNFQLKLYEGTGSIEFLYGPVTTNTENINANEAAAIGIKNGLGGANNFIDAITGSSYIASTDMNSLQVPRYNFRFTPGTTTPLPAATYSVGKGQDYFNLSEAVADLNHRGVSGPVTFRLTDAFYESSAANGSNIFPIILGPVQGASSLNRINIESGSSKASIRYSGNPCNGFINSADMKSLISQSQHNEPIFALIGADWVTLKNIVLEQGPSAPGFTATVKRGLFISNASATDGAQNNTLQDINTKLDRTDKNTIGIEQCSVFTDPVSLSGTNSYNHFYNDTVFNSYSGVFINGSVNYPDVNVEIGSSGSNKTLIGNSILNDIGGGSEQAWGIRATNQSGLKIFNTEIQNLAVNGSGQLDGIILEGLVSINNIYNNKIHDLANLNSGSAGLISGIRAGLNTTGNNIVHIYNNFIYRIRSQYAGSPSSIIQSKGIFLTANSGSASQEYDVDFNSVLMDGSSSLNTSSACLEIVTTSPMIQVRNNIFSNITTDQATSNHYGVVVPSASILGSPGSVWDYNDYYIAFSKNGFIGTGSGVDKNTLSGWQNAYGQDLHSKSVDPEFISAANLHTFSTVLNNAGSMTGITWITNDIDLEKRCPAGGCPGSGNSPDIGADEFDPASGSVLPLILMKFEGQNTNNKNNLYWTTTMENKFDHFAVERSGNGLNFSVIGYIKSNGSDTHSVQQYAFTDSSIQDHDWFYRLQLHDKDGHYSYSNVIQIRSQSLIHLQSRILPDPVIENATLMIECLQNDKVIIGIYDINGVHLYSGSKAVLKGQNKLPLENVMSRPGIYQCSIYHTNEHRTETFKFIRL